MSSSANDALIQRDLRVLWHPCTQMQDHEWLPLVPMLRGEGCWLIDADGKRYFDAISSWWVNLFGHGQPQIAAAIAEQARSLEHCILAGCTHEPAIALAESLLALATQPVGASPLQGPRLTKVSYADSGSAAIEIALKVSFQYWRNCGASQKQRFVVIEGGYHGETIGALSMTQVALYREVYGPLLLDPLVAPSPDAYAAPAGLDSHAAAERAADALDALLQEHAGSICAVLMEPLVQCAAGMRMHHPHYLCRLREICDRHRVHWIADEIAVGFGRTGSLFAHHQAGVSPDFLCLGKGLTGGFLPLSAVLCSEDIYQAFYDRYDSLRAFLHSHSYTGNPLACAAALATLNIFAQQDVLSDIAHIGAAMDSALQPLAEHPNVADIRRCGAIAAIELVRDKASREPFPWQQRRGLRVYQHGLQAGALLRPLGNVVYLMPPFVASEEEIHWVLGVAAEGIGLACRGED